MEVAATKLRSLSRVKLQFAEVSDLRVPPLVQSRWSQNHGGIDALLQLLYSQSLSEWLRRHGDGPAYALLFLAQAGVGTPSFTVRMGWSQKTLSLQGGDGVGGPYDWNNMVLDPNASTTDVQRRAIGALTSDSGIAVHMEYASSGSGAYTRYVPPALTQTFGYGNATYGYNSNSNLPSSNLTSMINPNLDASFPAILGITNATSGHEILVDGYGYTASTLYHHLNLGWAGAADAWYNLPTINTAYYSYSSVPECVYNVFPQGSGEIISGRVLMPAESPLEVQR